MRPALALYSRVMSDRPCKLDADVKRLWRMFLPGTPAPVCGTPEEFGAPVGHTAANMTDRVDDAGPNAGDRAHGRAVHPRRD